MSETGRFDPHVVGSMRVGYSRVGVIVPVFEKLIAAGRTSRVTRRKRIVGEDVDRDETTGWAPKTYLEEEIDALMKFGPGSKQLFTSGILGRLGGMIYTADPMNHLDQFVHRNIYYEISAPPVEVSGPRGGFLFRWAPFSKVELKRK